MNLSQLKAPKGANKRKKLLGRGSGSGHGKTSTRGQNGQTSRAGRHFYAGFEGGQNPLLKRIPKRGFSPRNKVNYQIINIEKLNHFKTGSVIDPDALYAKGMTGKHNAVKILSKGTLKHALTIKAHAFSKGAIEKIKSAGGVAEKIILKSKNNAKGANK
ncbi:MAG: 50S ribosomal protein L15 [Candidatus Gygaella obscura]|nr:50S ribosomal protein L15 [Candidatus Gygaella obscura]